MFDIKTDNMNELPLEELDSVFDQVYPMEPLLTKLDVVKRKRSDSNNSIICRKNSKTFKPFESIDAYLDLKDLDDLNFSDLKVSNDDTSLPLIKSLNSIQDLEMASKPINVWRSNLNGVSVYISWLTPSGTLSKYDANCIPLIRRVDNSLVNATLLLHAAGNTFYITLGVSEKEKSLICSFEKKVRCSNKESPFFGVWIPLKRAKTLAVSLCLVKIDIFLSDNLSDYFSSSKPISISPKSHDLLNHLIKKLSLLKNSEPNSDLINRIASILPGIISKSSNPVTSINSLVSALNQLLCKTTNGPKKPLVKKIIIQD